MAVSNVTPPGLVGEPIVGETLTCVPGVWTDDLGEIDHRLYWWTIGLGDSGSDGTVLTYLVAADDVGKQIDCTERCYDASNGSLGAETTGQIGPVTEATAASLWVTAEDVLAYLDEVGAPSDNLTLSTAAWRAAVERRHPSYFDESVPAVYAPPDDIRLGTIRAAAMTYQARVSVSVGDESGMWDTLGASRAEIMRQLRWRLPTIV